MVHKRIHGASHGDGGDDPIPGGGASFPSPDYDSGWTALSQGSSTQLTHSLGGDTDNYMAIVTPKFLISGAYANWSMNESSGTLISDSSPYSRDGTTVNMDNTNWVPGKLGNALSFDGVDEQTTFSTIAGFERTDTFSFECWLKTTATDEPVFISKSGSSSGDSGYRLELRASGKPQVILRNTYDNLIRLKTSTATVIDGEWHHVVVTFDGSSSASGVKIYVDGSNQDITVEDDSLSASILNDRDFKLGAVGTDSRLYTGLIDEVVVYDRELTSAEVEFRWNNGTGRDGFGVSSMLHDIGVGNPTTGIHYENLTDSQVTITRGPSNLDAQEVRARIWKY